MAAVGAPGVRPEAGGAYHYLLMVTVYAQAAVVTVGVVLALICLLGIAAPTLIVGTVERTTAARGGMVVAVVVRLVLGFALLLASPRVRWPDLFAALGWLTLATAVVLPLFGRRRVLSVVDWIRGLHPVVARIWLLVGLLFGLMLAYGAAGVR